MYEVEKHLITQSTCTTGCVCKTWPFICWGNIWIRSEQDIGLSVFHCEKNLIGYCQGQDSLPHRLNDNIRNSGCHWWVNRAFNSAGRWLTGAVNNHPLRDATMCTNSLRYHWLLNKYDYVFNNNEAQGFNTWKGHCEVLVLFLVYIEMYKWIMSV